MRGFANLVGCYCGGDLPPLPAAHPTTALPLTPTATDHCSNRRLCEAEARQGGRRQSCKACFPIALTCHEIYEFYFISNLPPAESEKPSKTGKAVVELQARLPEARVLYSSATGGWAGVYGWAGWPRDLAQSYSHPKAC